MRVLFAEAEVMETQIILFNNLIRQLETWLEARKQPFDKKKP